MAPKQQLDKAAWQWAESTDPEDITEENIATAYRLHFKACHYGICRKNCKGNPNCLVNLGEQGWFGQIDDAYWHDIGDAVDERRKPGTFVGLKNLGATCYVNTFLQLWFNNLTFRTAILKWRDPREYQLPPDEAEDKSAPQDECKLARPTTVCGHLQLIFAQLLFSNRRYLDPSPFIQCLKLDSSQQQDAQEFSKLFIMLLEDQLSSSDVITNQLVQQNFMGTYHYVTRCSVCGTESQTPSKFYELDLNIKGNKDLRGCIDEFLKEEVLEGDNQYMCGKCNCKRNASRKIQLHSLPPVLNLQLLRFVFDRRTGHKKKLSSFIQFPEELDMSAELRKPVGSHVYQLKAVLIHSGPSAYSGHYIAHIHDAQADVWYKFNDEVIEKMKSKNLELGNETDLEGKSDVKKPRTAKGVHSSRNAYMLVYTLKSSAQETVEEIKMTDLPTALQNLVNHDNQRFDVWLKELSKMKDENITRGHQRQEEVKDLYSRLKVKPDDLTSAEWIPTAWLSKWLAVDHSHQVPSVDTLPLLCSHSKLDPDQVQSAKCITHDASEEIYSHYGGGPRLKVQESLCKECVRERCREIHTKARMAEDTKVIAALLKANPDVTEGVWVGKISLRSWRKMVTAKSDESEPSDDRAEITAEDEVSERPLGFNEDLLCEDHGHLNPDPSCRRLVPLDIWQRLKSHFPDAETFDEKADVCPQCLAAQAEELKAQNSKKALASQMKSQLMNLYLNKHRPNWADMPLRVNIVPSEFLAAWRSFIKDPSNNPLVESMCNESILCQHGGFLYRPEVMEFNGSDALMSFIHPSEWKILSQYSTPDIEVFIEKTEDDSGRVTFSVTPELCSECCESREKAEFQAQFSYKDATLYIHRITKEDSVQVMNSNGLSADSPSSNGTNGSDEEVLKRKKGAFDPEVAPPEKMARTDPAPTRKSSRRRCMRGEKRVQVDASDSLRDLKLKVMQIFSVPPFDQHLMHNGRELRGDQTPLANLAILPDDVIYLLVDEPAEDPIFFEDASKASVPEKGFQGTGLVSR